MSSKGKHGNSAANKSTNARLQYKMHKRQRQSALCLRVAAVAWLLTKSKLISYASHFHLRVSQQQQQQLKEIANAIV